MAIDWARVGRTAVRVGRRYGPTVAREVRRRLDDGGASPALSRKIAEGRPATTVTAPTSSRARRIAYTPDLDGQADPGEIVWTWVEFEENDGRGKDRPVLVVGRDGDRLLGLQLSSQDSRDDDEGWLGLGSGPWDSEGRPSWVRLDRVLDVPEQGIRREGAICPRPKFDAVADRLRADYGWR
ncbi:type II toxin-antitoxin system PemK/MazF family toxin [Dietzia sp. B32]|uniref:type II toxin-antitoxin system PemK/MazF family toxin n=1 Tax=Dietzia sp. B32 TaxID=2915130 RepID=UPI0021AD8C02|nr:type II toxin-antitoxin system PemK/MazF family toxin [Dietzia sp. B32]UVE94682.1 type II toxin-antitoxin system PemK/MazF family toxin [Dietzia sp. B32]